jgi:hypothetical protein
MGPSKLSISENVGKVKGRTTIQTLNKQASLIGKETLLGQSFLGKRHDISFIQGINNIGHSGVVFLFLYKPASVFVPANRKYPLAIESISNIMPSICLEGRNSNKAYEIS